MWESIVQVPLLGQTQSGPCCPMEGVAQLNPALGGCSGAFLGRGFCLTLQHGQLSPKPWDH